MQTTQPTPPPTPKERLVESALQLFYERGFHATGIDMILTKANVSKPTLYKYFDSKDALILAALHRRDESVRQWLIAEMEQRAATPAERILALFDVLADWFQSPDFQGCMFINATAEYAQHDYPVHQASAEHKRVFGQYILGLTSDAGVANPEELTAQILVLMEGAIATAHVSGPGVVAQQARKTVELLLSHAVA
ncbi:MAG: TetR family transcriptional regulator [Nitrospirales bacterium]|nr:MAG: TetR family transcriptional regulator [Nitrospirales bacterium]